MRVSVHRTTEHVSGHPNPRLIHAAADGHSAQGPYWPGTARSSRSTRAPVADGSVRVIEDIFNGLPVQARHHEWHLERASALIVDVHRFFTNWISGACVKRADLMTTGATRHLALVSGVIGTGGRGPRRSARRVRILEDFQMFRDGRLA
jgi:hypothetical protein